MISARQVRRTFLDYFREQGHSELPSASLVPHGDPTLLLTSAGMVPFKPFFMGEAAPANRRMTTSQKCFRTVDIETVGNMRNLTFFEMLGNFSIGDYFKRGAITFAWDLLTNGFGLPKDKLWTTVFPSDQESYDLWREIAGLPGERIVRLHENWWGPAGATGPCGPDTEIFLDRGPALGCGSPDCKPGCDCERYLEIWNLVLMQFNRQPDGTDLPLPRPSIDTGAGLERMTMALNDMQSVYDTDLFMPIMQHAAELAGIRYGAGAKTDYSLRVIGDHSRAITFLVGDGVLPSNEGRGYILRRVLRRAVRHGHFLGMTEPFLTRTTDLVTEIMGEAYPELTSRRDFILRVIDLEERRFRETLTEGLERLDTMLDGMPARVLPGEEAFRLYDTFGFPLDITRDHAAERGFTVDEDGFKAAMEEQRQRARKAKKFGLDAWQETYRALALPETSFLGFDSLNADAPVLNIMRDGSAVDEAHQGDSVEVVLSQTPFYAESGGQVGDTGLLTGPRGIVQVTDTQKALRGAVVHLGAVREGVLQAGETVRASVDVERRLDIARNHTATHLLHKALQGALGEHATQHGSLVAPERLRFDFSHLQGVTGEELHAIESQVNSAIRADLPVETAVLPYARAIQNGATALFGEKYGETVRMVTVGQEIQGGQEGQPAPGAGYFSRELCGGTHLHRTGQIGYLKITSEGSIGAGLRRIEAVTGRGAEEYLNRQLGLLAAVSEALKATPEVAVLKAQALEANLTAAHREAERLQREVAKRRLDTLAAQVREIRGVRVLAARVEASGFEALREQGDWLRDRLGSAIIVLGALVTGPEGEKPAFVAVVTPDLVARGYRAGDIVRQVAAVTGGSGGGRPELAQAGGKDASRLDEALALVAGMIF
jgi:alanyl-tRNA synthetase